MNGGNNAKAGSAQGVSKGYHRHDAPHKPNHWSGQRESNPHEKLGKLSGYHYIMPAQEWIMTKAGR